MSKDVVLYADMVASASYDQSELKDKNNAILSELKKILSRLNFQSDTENVYVNFTGDGFVCVVKENDRYGDFIREATNLYSSCAIGQSTPIRLALHAGDNDWDKIGADILPDLKPTPYGKAIITGARLLAAAEENNFVLSAEIVKLAGGIREVNKEMNGCEFSETTIATKDVDENGKREELKAYNAYRVDGRFGSPFYGSTSSQHSILANLMCDKFHEKYQSKFQEILGSHDGFEYKLSILLRHTNLEGRKYYRALPGRLFMNGKAEPKKAISTISFPCNHKLGEVKGCPGHAAKNNKTRVCFNEEHIEIGETEEFGNYVSKLNDVGLNAQDVKKMYLYQGKYLPSCFISIPYFFDESKDPLPPIVLSIDTEKQVSKSKEELEEKGELISELLNEYAQLKVALIGLTA